MALVTYPLNNIEYTAEDAELYNSTRKSGVYANDSFSASVTGADNNLTIGTGIAWIKNADFSGKVVGMKQEETIDLGIADSLNPRIDAIVLQFSANNNNTELIVKSGSPSSTPVAPSVVRTESVYELHLYHVFRSAGDTAITADKITDLRMNQEYCGLMADAITEVDTSAIEAQISYMIENLQTEIDGVKEESGVMFRSDYDQDEDGAIDISAGGTGANTQPQALAAISGMSGTTRHGMVTYSQASDFLSASCTTAEALTALPVDSVVSFTHSDSHTIKLTDVPFKYGTVILVRGLNANYCRAIGFNNSAAISEGTGGEMYRFNYSANAASGYGAATWTKVGDAEWKLIGSWTNGGSLNATFTNYNELLFVCDYKGSNFYNYGSSIHVPVPVIKGKANTMYFATSGYEVSGSTPQDRFCVEMTTTSATDYNVYAGGSQSTSYKIYCYGR